MSSNLILSAIFDFFASVSARMSSHRLPDARIVKIRDYILTMFEPEAILLHGSRLRNDATDSSDYDIAVITANGSGICPHEYEGMMLDIEALPLDTRIIEASNKVPNWPLKILFDANGIGKRIYDETEQLYQNGPLPLSAQEWNNRATYTKRLIAKIQTRGTDLTIRRYYLADVYMRVIRYWFEIRKMWTVSPYRALPIIQEEDAVFFAELARLWTDDYLMALHKIDKHLFGHVDQ